MQRFLLVIVLFFMTAFASCVNGEPNEPEEHIPAPPVIITDNPDYQAQPLAQEIILEDVLVPEIPPFNEYAISMDFEPESRIINGIISVRYTNRSNVALSELVFRVPLYNYMDILHVSKDNEDVPFNLQGTVLRLDLPRPLEQKESIQVRIQFEAYIPMVAQRTGANQYAVWCGAFLPVVAVFGENGWHTDMMEAANYTVEIIAPVGYVVAGTGTKTQAYVANQIITEFTAQVTRDFAFAISPYFQRSSKMSPSGLVEINLYHYSPHLPTEHILNVAAEALTFFEELIGSYPYPQLCIVETDMFRSGERFSSVIFMDSNHLRTSPTLSSLRNEIGRQWFSVIIGGNPIEEAWLNGGLAHFLQSGLISRPEEFRLLIEREQRIVQDGLRGIADEESRRLATHIDSYERWSDYFMVQHRKAKLMFYSLYREMGDDNFKELLREYYTRFAFRIASASDFIELAEEIHGRSLARFFNYWLYTTELPDLPGAR